MPHFEIAVVGSGIGGSLIAGLNKDKKTIIFEKDKNVGGCASTFKRFGNYYNSGATTLVGYEDRHILKKHFDAIGLKPNITKSSCAMRVIQNDTILDRTSNFEEFLQDIQILYPNPNNHIFWNKIKRIDEKFWRLQNIYFAKFSFYKYLKTANFASTLFQTFGFDIFKSADSFIKETLGEISKEYQSFIDAQLLITIQSTSKQIPLLSLALGLAYPFHDVFYVNGGMGSLIEDILQEVNIHTKEEIIKIQKEKNHWILHSNYNSYKAQKVILNSSIYETSRLFDDMNIKNYYEKFEFSDQSAFVVYLTLQTKEDFLDHYQFIFDEILPNCTSKSFFVSFSKKDDFKMSNHGYSVTISTHTKALFWKNLNKEQYDEEKTKTMEFIKNKFLEYFANLKQTQIIQIFSATSFTFNRYINRYNCGGKPFTFTNIASTPSCNTPFGGLYNVGDTVFAGQGWPGIAIGVNVLNKEINGGS